MCDPEDDLCGRILLYSAPIVWILAGMYAGSQVCVLVTTGLAVLDYVEIVLLGPCFNADAATHTVRFVLFLGLV